MALGLTACAGSTGFDNPKLSTPPVLLPAPAGLERDCQTPKLLPEDGRLTQEQVEGLWSQDRANLVDCRKRKAGVQDYYRTRDAGLQGTE